MKYDAFALTLMVNHWCNFRCTYCFTGAKFQRAMPEAVAKKAIDRAFSSISPGGLLELGFFGGEPLNEAALIESLQAYSRDRAAHLGMRLCCSLTTNGSYSEGAAWRVMLDPGTFLSVSCDGLPVVHDRFRSGSNGQATSRIVEAAIRKLVAARRDFNVIMVVRPETVRSLPEGIRHLQSLGVRGIEPSLDLWTRWSDEDCRNLEDAISMAADLWRDALPGLALSWFDEKAAKLAQVPIQCGARCSFGKGQIAVSPAGHLYPCERLIGEDRADNPMRLRGGVPDGDDFLFGAPSCGTSCPCSNFVRTGSPKESDVLLQRLDRTVLAETARVLNFREATHA